MTNVCEDEKKGKLSNMLVDDFIKEPDLKQFYLNDVDELLANYEPGKPDNKPTAMKQIKEKQEQQNKLPKNQIYLCSKCKAKLTENDILENRNKLVHFRDEFELNLILN